MGPGTRGSSSPTAGKGPLGRRSPLRQRGLGLGTPLSASERNRATPAAAPAMLGRAPGPGPSPPSHSTGPMPPDLLLQPRGALSNQPVHPPVSASRNKWPEAEVASPKPEAETPPLSPLGGRLGAVAWAASRRDPGGAAGRPCRVISQDARCSPQMAPLGRGQRIESEGGSDQSCCAWTDLDRGTYLEPL